MHRGPRPWGSLPFLVNALQDRAVTAAYCGILIVVHFRLYDLVKASSGIMCLDPCEGVLRLFDFAEFGMADDKTNERPPWHRCHFRVAGCCLAISSSRGQYDAAKVFIPPHSVWVAVLGFGYFTKRFIRPVRVIEEKCTDTENERVVRIEGNRTVETDFSLPELAQVQESKAGREMAVRLVGVQAATRFLPSPVRDADRPDCSRPRKI